MSNPRIELTEFEILVNGLRGDNNGVETSHAGSICVVSALDRTRFEVGCVDRSFPLRSTAKPFQLLPYLLDGLHTDTPGDNALANLAVMMASHSGEPMHTERVARILEGIGLTHEHLRCGVHPPQHELTRQHMLSTGQKPNALHCNCSGKHAGMLAVCLHQGWPLNSYLAPSHPMQLRIRALLEHLVDLPADSLVHAIDGCSLPTYWLSLRNLAHLFFLLARPDCAPSLEGRPVTALIERLFEAGVRYPELVAGSGRLDSALMRALAGSGFAKTGAAGLYAVALRPCARFPDGLGIAVKIADGDPGGRVRAVVITEVLRQLGVDENQMTAVEDRMLRNLRHLAVGELRPVFSLQTA